ncbi:MAG: polysaccharide (de)acetylase [Thermaurantimonas sp.]
MNILTFKENIRTHLSNSFGKTLRRKIVVIESDDWGSIRTASKEAYQAMRQFGLKLETNHYGFDSLESNEDLELLFNVLLDFKDATGRPPVFTPFCNMANPDFETIESTNFSDYAFESIDKTIARYPNHDKLLHYWQEGERRRLFCPQLHGREHIHVGRWWKLIAQEKDEGMLEAFRWRSVGASRWNGKEYPNYLGALHPEKKSEIPGLHKMLEDAGRLYEQYMGHKPTCFVAPNAEEPAELETTLKKIGVKTITRAKRRIYPLGDGQFKKEWNWPGKINAHGQVILVRNAFFEPVCFGEPDKAHITDWVDRCLKQISIAFFWNKPAVISSHRVNYIGFIEPKNRDKGIRELRRLLKAIIKKWPEVEFMTSAELGELLMNKA